jgi:hypothetical protein
VENLIQSGFVLIRVLLRGSFAAARERSTKSHETHQSFKSSWRNLAELLTLSGIEYDERYFW